MDHEWAAVQLKKFVAQVDSLEADEETLRVGYKRRLLADEVALDLEQAVRSADHDLRAFEPAIQIIMDAVDPELRRYDNSEHDWNVRWRPAQEAALRALGLCTSAAEAKVRMRTDAPDLAADQFHEWVWEAAQPMWEAQSYSMAVLHAAQSINARAQQKLGRYDTSDANLCGEAFSVDEPKVGRPRLRFDGDRTSETWRSLQEGAGFFGRGCFRAMRNPVAHSHEHVITSREAMEQLAALSQLARWIDKCAVETV